MPSYAFLWRTSDFSMEVGETATITLNYPNKGDSISIWEDGVQIGTTTTNTYEYTPISVGTHILHYFNTIDCSPLTVTVTGGGVSGNDTTTLNGALETLGETLADNLTTMGITNVDASDGLITLANAILDIKQDGNEQEIVSFDNLTTEFNYTRKRGDYGFSVTIPSSITSLGNSCFRGCTGLTSVTIPSSVTSLGINCFQSCTNLVDYQLYWETPPVIWDSNLMPNNTDTYFTIPNGTTANYTAKSFPSNKLIERSE